MSAPMTLALDWWWYLIASAGVLMVVGLVAGAWGRQFARWQPISTYDREQRALDDFRRRLNAIAATGGGVNVSVRVAPRRTPVGPVIGWDGAD